MQSSQTNSPKRIRDKLAVAAATFALLAAGTLSSSSHQRLSQPTRPEQCRLSGGAGR